MDVNDDAGILNARVALTLIASRLAPTGLRTGQAFGEPMPCPICTAVPAVISSAHLT